MSDAYSDATTIVAAYVVILGAIIILAALLMVAWEQATAMWRAHQLGRIERRRRR